MAAISEYFRASFGKLDQAMQSRIGEWARTNCIKHKVVHAVGGDDTDVELYAQRPEAKSSKSIKMMLRAVFQNWGSPLDAGVSDWLRLLSKSEFEEAIEEDAIQVVARARHAPVSAVAAPDMLSAGFDTRAFKLYNKLLEEGRIVACRV